MVLVLRLGFLQEVHQGLLGLLFIELVFVQTVQAQNLAPEMIAKKKQEALLNRRAILG